MNEKESLINKLEKGRAEFAYRCVLEAIELKKKNDGKLMEQVIQDFKEEVRKNLRKDIQENKITETRITQLLEEPSKYIKDYKEKKLSDSEMKVIENWLKLLDNYKSYVRKIPQMILSNGLGQTLAFIKAKTERGNAYDLIYTQLTEYMKSNTTARITMPLNENDLVQWVISSNSSDYRYITQELLAFLNWLKRFAEGMIEEE